MKELVKRLINKIRKSSFGKAVLMLAGGTAIAQILTIAVSPIISRLFSPDDFGILSVYTSILGIIAVFATLRYEFSIPIAENEKKAVNALGVTLLSVISISLISLVLFIVFSDSLFTLVNAQELRPYYWLISLGVLAQGTYIVFRYWAFRKKDFKTITKTTVNQSVYKNSFFVFWGFFIGSPIGLILGTIIGRSAGIWVLSKDFRRKETKLIKNISFRSLGSIAKRYIKFPIFSSWAALLNSLGLQLPVLMLSSLYGTEVTGSFGFAVRIVALPMVFIGQAVGDVFFSEGAQLSKTNPERMLALSRKLLKKLVLVGIIPFSILVLFGPVLFSFVFGEVWYTAGVYARILSLMVFTRFIVTPVSNVFNMLERQVLGFFLHGFRAGIVIAAFILSDYLSFSPLYCVSMYSISMIIVYLLTLILAQKVIKDRIKEKNNL
ncbi:MAG: oligosaccharide flippase family protein [Candidatus Mcinerneyibacterium aminivorans]|uniref:Oligosaccharide flippase family protein n=1 Tax=Candidatus Mcinerneyibacterium aminivorans TaxID=2703815 RepID=A0A5D0MFL6_9BACT|nr:MAG: oligosaccharide flippase family protein [Candidatus Mcinerneyibacterium aminivorans]